MSTSFGETLATHGLKAIGLDCRRYYHSRNFFLHERPRDLSICVNQTIDRLRPSTNLLVPSRDTTLACYLHLAILTRQEILALADTHRAHGWSSRLEDLRQAVQAIQHWQTYLGDRLVREVGVGYEGYVRGCEMYSAGFEEEGAVRRFREETREAMAEAGISV